MSSSYGRIAIPIHGTYIVEDWNPYLEPPERHYALAQACMLAPLPVIRANEKAYNRISEISRYNDPRHICGICHEEGSMGQVPPLLPCQHRFHPGCLRPWFEHCSPSANSQTPQRLRQQPLPSSPRLRPTGAMDLNAAAIMRPWLWGPPPGERPTCPVCRREMVYACGHTFQVARRGHSWDQVWDPKELTYPCHEAPSKYRPGHRDRDISSNSNSRGRIPRTAAANDIKKLVIDRAFRLRQQQERNNDHESTTIGDRDHETEHAADPSTANTSTLYTGTPHIGTVTTGTAYTGIANTGTAVTTTCVSTVPVGTDSYPGRETGGATKGGPIYGTDVPDMGLLAGQVPLNWVLTWAAWDEKIVEPEHRFMLGLRTWDEHLRSFLEHVCQLARSRKVNTRVAVFEIRYERLRGTVEVIKKHEKEFWDRVAIVCRDIKDDGTAADEEKKRKATQILEPSTRKALGPRAGWHEQLRLTCTALRCVLDCDEVCDAVHKLQGLTDKESRLARRFHWLWRRRRQMLGIM